MTDFVKCVICGKQMKQITHTHVKQHGLDSMSKYIVLYPDAKISSDETIKLKSRLKKQAFIEKYGKDLGEIKNKEYSAIMRNKNLFKTKAEKHGWNEERFIEYNKSRAVTLKNQIAKHGDIEGPIRFKAYCDKQSIAGNKVEYFISKYGQTAGLLKYEEVNSKKGITLTNLISKYGEELGKEKYDEWIVSQSRPVKDKLIKTYGELLGKIKYEKWILNHTNFSGKSQIQETFLKHLISTLPYTLSIYSCLTKEFAVHRENGKFWLIDFVITQPIKLAIEFNGDFWHANPKGMQRKIF